MSSIDRRRAALRVQARRAARLVAPLWPTERFVAVNPLLGLLDLGFEGAVGEAQRWLGIRGYPAEPGVGAPAPAPRTLLERIDAEVGSDLARWVDDELGRTCVALLGAAPGPLVASGSSPYEVWRERARHDRRLRRVGGRPGRTFLSALPARADDAVLDALDRLAIADGEVTQELRGQLARTPGWAAYAVWSDDWAGDDDPAPQLPLLDLLAISLSLDALMAAAGAVPSGSRFPAPHDRAPEAEAAGPSGPDARRLVTREGQLRVQLLAALDRPRPTIGAVEGQAVFCIDARSEGLRRQLEEVGRYDTFGFAGFFAAPVRVRGLGAEEAYASAPVLLTPEVEVGERPSPGAESAVARTLAGQQRRLTASATTSHVAHGPAAMYAWAEVAGWVMGPMGLARTLRPPARGPAAPLATEMDLAGERCGLDLDARALIAETALRAMGLTERFAPVVLVCGHGSTSTANAHAASLDCGACAGNHGGPNARILTAIANDPAVRDQLAARGIVIPGTTWFVAGEHDTTTDEVTVLDRHLVPESHRERVGLMADDLAVAGARNAADRLARLPGARTGDARLQVRRRAGDWAETRPEWGLARNAAFIVGPRDLTRGVDLDGRAFLHSYDAAADVEGSVLETILTAPMVVAHWINAQYYFSTVDPEVFGAGDKTLHNPVPGVGVLLGTGSDLRVGLPWQSVGVGEEPYHEPLRLLTVVEAPLERIDAVIARNPILRQLFDGEWVHLAARAGEASTWMRRLPGGGWVDASTVDGADGADRRDADRAAPALVRDGGPERVPA